MRSNWTPGDQILLRTWGGWRKDRPTRGFPVTVVEDSSGCIAIYFAAGTPIKYEVQIDGSPIPRALTYEQRYTMAKRTGDGLWHTENRLMLVRPGAAHAYSLFWEASDWTFHGWYVDLIVPFLRTPLGFDSEDQVLDIVISRDLSWYWKDEDEFADAQRIGHFTPEEAAAIRAEGERVIRNIEARGWPFDKGWESWRPDPGWPIPPVPPNWDAVADSED